METAFYLLVFAIPLAFFAWILARSVRSGMRKVEFGDVLLARGFRRSATDSLVFEGSVGGVPLSVRHVFVQDEEDNRTERGWRVFATHGDSQLAPFTLRNRAADALDSRVGYEVFDKASLLYAGEADPLRQALAPTSDSLGVLVARIPHARLEAAGDEIAVELPVVDDPELVLLAARAVAEVSKRKDALPTTTGSPGQAPLPQARKL